MKKALSRLIPTLVIALFPMMGHSAWYEVTGKSAIVSSKEQASLHALEDAIYEAVSFAGADIGSISNLMPMLNAQQDEFQFANHEVRYVLVEKRQIINDEMYVKVRIDIYPSATGCHVDQYKKTFLIGNIDINDPQQAVMGQIYDLGDDFANIINKQLTQESRSFISVGTTDYAIDKQHPERLKMIAQDTDAQYIIGGVISDLTATMTTSASDSMINRQFAMELEVFDGKTGSPVMNRSYREVARWPFPKTSQVDTRSARFWASSYGEMMLRVSRHVMLDLESELSCKITLPEVVSKFGNNVTMDLGRIHGVRVGDKLQLWHTGAFIDPSGLPRNQVIRSEITLTVTRVYEHEAELSVDQENLAGSIQIGDVMHKQL
jgi:flagellar H-ring protein FlgT